MTTARATLADFTTSSLTERRGRGRPRSSAAADSGENGLRIWQDSLIDFLLLNPTATQRDLARKFEVSDNYISNVMRSDSFQRELASRRHSLTEKVNATIAERLHGLFHKSVDKMEKQLELDPNIAHGEVRETMKSALDGLGYSSGSRSAADNGPKTQFNILISKEDLASARSSMRGLRIVDSDETDSAAESLADLAAE